MLGKTYLKSEIEGVATEYYFSSQAKQSSGSFEALICL